MKKAKIMLMTIAVLATVGTALAFNVVKKSNSTYCYLETNVDPGTGQGACPNQINNHIANGGKVVNYYYTTLTATSCIFQSNCQKKAFNFGPE